MEVHVHVPFTSTILFKFPPPSKFKILYEALPLLMLRSTGWRWSVQLLGTATMGVARILERVVQTTSRDQGDIT